MKERNIEKTDKGYILNALQDIPDLRDWPFEPALHQLNRYIRPPRTYLNLTAQHGLFIIGTIFPHMTDLEASLYLFGRRTLRKE